MIYDVTRRNGVSIGTIDFSESINEYGLESPKRFPNISKLGVCEVKVYEREGMHPHIHIYGNGKEVCVALGITKYFSHEPQHSQFSNSKQKADLDKWFRAHNTKVSEAKNQNFTNYQASVQMWNELNPIAKLDFNAPQPDYSMLDGEIKK